MKKYLSSIILGVIIVILAVAIGCLYFSDKKETTETTNIPVETSEPVATATPEPTPTTEPTPEPTEEPTEFYTDELFTYLRSFDFFATAPKEIIIDFLEQNQDGDYNYKESREELERYVNDLVKEFPDTKLEDFWGELTPEPTYPTFDEMFGTKEERDEARWQKLADSLGITVEEAKAMYAEDNTEEESQGTQQASGNPDSPYISDRYGHQVGSQMVIYDYITVTYQGEDVWMDENSKPYSVVKDHGNGYMEFAPGIFAKPGEQPVSERLGYQPGDSMSIQSLGYSFNRIYMGNDLWYDDNDPDDILIASMYNNELIFTSYN